MNLLEVYFGFHAPGFRNHTGRIDPRCWLGHVEVWGYTEDGTWLFLDPAGAGMSVTVIHRHEAVVDALGHRMRACDSILRMEGAPPSFALPIHGLLTCASIAGQLVSVRALLPWTLKTRLLRKGAVLVHEKRESTSGRPCGEGSEGA